MKNGSLPEDGQMMIDIDNLQGLAIYLVWALNYPEILTECLMTSEFISEGISQCSRTIFLLLLQSSSEYLLKKFTAPID